MNAAELNAVLETEIRNLRAKKTNRADAVAIQKLAGSMIAAARLELQFAKQANTTPHSPYYGSNGRRALTNGAKKRA